MRDSSLVLETRSANCHNSMVCFDTSGAMALSKEDMEKLVVRGSGSDIKAKLEACGVEGGEVRADIIIPAEAGKVKRSRWVW